MNRLLSKVRLASVVVGSSRSRLLLPQRHVIPSNISIESTFSVRNITVTAVRMSSDKVVNYEDVVTYKDKPDVFLVDVREPDERRETGAIPTSVNIPMGELSSAFQGMSAADFKSKYGRDLPSKDAEVVFHCKMGGRAAKAMDAVTELGYTNTKVYKGSMNDWLSRQQ